MRPLMPSLSVQELGLSGGNLQQQLADSEEERKKKLLAQAKAMQSPSAYGPSAQALFPNLSGV